MVYLESLTLSGVVFTVDPPCRIDDDKTIIITGDGRVMWGSTGKVIARIVPGGSSEYFRNIKWEEIKL